MRTYLPALVILGLLAFAAPAAADTFPGFDHRCAPPCPGPCGPCLTPYGTCATASGPCAAPYPYYRPYYRNRPVFRRTPYFYRPAPHDYACRTICGPTYAPGPRTGYFRRSGGTRVGFGARRFGACPSPGNVRPRHCR